MPASAIRVSWSPMLCARLGCTPAIGSSSSRTLGSASSARMISTRRRWPPERPPAYASAYWVRPKPSRISSARSMFALSSTPQRRRPRNDPQNESPDWPGIALTRFSSTVSFLNSLASWKVRTSPASRSLVRRHRGDVLALVEDLRPLIDGRVPASIASVVDLPAPFGPISPVTRPWRISMLTSDTTVDAVERLGEALDREDRRGDRSRTSSRRRRWRKSSSSRLPSLHRSPRRRCRSDDLDGGGVGGSGAPLRMRRRSGRIP